MILIGICGASGSGKSTLADALANRLGDRCLVIQQDCYYRDHPDLSFTERAKLNYDEPGIFDHDLLLHDMNTLISGQPITRKAYDYTQHRRADTDELIYPHDVVILEGIHCFFDPRLMKLMFMFSQYIANYVEFADIIVAGGGKNARIVDILAGYVSDELSKRAYEA